MTISKTVCLVSSIVFASFILSPITANARTLADSIPLYYISIGGYSSPSISTYLVGFDRKIGREVKRLQLRFWGKEQRAIEHCIHFTDLNNERLSISNFLEVSDERTGFDVGTYVQQLATLTYSKQSYNQNGHWSYSRGIGIGVKRWRTRTASKAFKQSSTFNFLSTVRCGQDSGGLYILSLPPTSNSIFKENRYSRFDTVQGEGGKKKGFQYTFNAHAGLSYNAITNTRMTFNIESNIIVYTDINTVKLSPTNPTPDVALNRQIEVGPLLWIGVDIQARIGWRL